MRGAAPGCRSCLQNTWECLRTRPGALQGRDQDLAQDVADAIRQGSLTLKNPIRNNDGPVITGHVGVCHTVTFVFFSLPINGPLMHYPPVQIGELHPSGSLAKGNNHPCARNIMTRLFYGSTVLAGLCAMTLVIGCGGSSGLKVTCDGGNCGDAKKDTSGAKLDGLANPDVVVKLDSQAPTDGPAANLDGPAANLDGPAPKLDGPAANPDGLAAKLDGPAANPDGPAAKLDAPKDTTPVSTTDAGDGGTSDSQPLLDGTVTPPADASADDGADTGPDAPVTVVDAPVIIVDAPVIIVDAAADAGADLVVVATDAADGATPGVDGGAGDAVDGSTCPGTGPVCIGNATDDFSSGTLAPHWSPWDNCGTTAVSAGALVLDRPAACPGTLGGSLGAVLDTCNFEVCGDFDAQIDFALTNFAIPATASRYAGMSVHSPAAATPAWNLSVERLDSSYVNANVPQQQNYKAYTTSSVDADSTFVATADTSGRFRITRVGTTLTAYYWNTSAWVSITATSAPADPMLVLGVYAGSDDPTAFTVAFDNFSIVSTP